MSWMGTRSRTGVSHQRAANVEKNPKTPAESMIHTLILIPPDYTRLQGISEGRACGLSHFGGTRATTKGVRVILEIVQEAGEPPTPHFEVTRKSLFFSGMAR
jgi:hypothetical protein